MRGSGAGFVGAVGLVFFGVNVIAAWTFRGPEVNGQEHSRAAGDGPFPNVVGEKQTTREEPDGREDGEPRLARHVNPAMSSLFFGLLGLFFGRFFFVMLVVPETVARV